MRIATVVVLLALTACGSSDRSPASTAAESTTGSESTPDADALSGVTFDVFRDPG